jgi:hypothetical protein
LVELLGFDGNGRLVLGGGGRLQRGLGERKTLVLLKHLLKLLLLLFQNKLVIHHCYQYYRN